MKNQTYLILTILFIIIISVFAVLNVSEVEVNYVFWRGSSPLIFVILFSVLLGGILATCVSLRKFLQLRRENKQLLKQLTELESKVALMEVDETLSNENHNNIDE